MKKSTPKKQQEASAAVTFLILLVSSVVVLTIGSLVLLEQDTWVQSQKLWLISRSAAISAYIVLTIVVLLGNVLSHPRNKDTWRLTPKILPWHQAAVGILFALLAIHLLFSLADSKSGVSLSVFWRPMDSKYHHIATLFGVIGFYLMLLIGITAGLRKWVKLWLPTHRLSFVLWIFVSLHGFYDGTDSLQFHMLYEVSVFLVIATFIWRHWANNNRRMRQTKTKSDSQGGESIELQS